MTPAELHTAVLAALAAAEQAETRATPAPWSVNGKSIDAERGCRGRVVCSVGAYECGWPSKPDAALIAGLRNTAAAVYAGVRDILTRHAPEPWPANAGPAVVPATCSACHTGWWCPDYRAAARMIPHLPQEAADALGHRP